MKNPKQHLKRIETKLNALFFGNKDPNIQLSTAVDVISEYIKQKAEFGTTVSE